MVSKNTQHATKEAKLPTDQNKLRYFLGLWNFFRRVFPNFPRVGSPLNSLFENNKPTYIGSLTDKEYEAFDILKRKLIEPQILVLPKRQ